MKKDSKGRWITLCREWEDDEYFDYNNAYKILGTKIAKQFKKELKDEETMKKYQEN